MIDTIYDLRYPKRYIQSFGGEIDIVEYDLVTVEYQKGTAGIRKWYTRDAWLRILQDPSHCRPPADPKKILGKFKEFEFLEEVGVYIRGTYDQHYAHEPEEGSGKQLIEIMIEDMGFSVDFLKANIIKYVVRYGKKDGHNIKDLMKAMHYLTILHHYTQLENKETL